MNRFKGLLSPEARAERDAQRAAEGRVRWSHDCKGRLLTIRDGLTVVPYEQTRGGWYAVVVEAISEADQKSYPRGGYNIVVTDDDVETAEERYPASRGDSRIEFGIRCAHGIQGPYLDPGEPIANCGELGTVVRRVVRERIVGEWGDA